MKKIKDVLHEEEIAKKFEDLGLKNFDYEKISPKEKKKLVITTKDNVFKHEIRCESVNSDKKQLYTQGYPCIHFCDITSVDLVEETPYELPKSEQAILDYNNSLGKNKRLLEITRQNSTNHSPEFIW